MKYNTKLSYCGKSDMGRVRTNNEDAFIAQQLWDENTYLAVAIDGVGGYEGGEIAADIARKTIPEFLLASPNGERVELLKQAVTAANNAIFEARETDPEHGQMSCVLTAAIVDITQRQISMAHVGDSRLYSFHNGKLTKLSHDHSLVGYREEIGDLSEEDAMHHPQRNVIDRDLGSQKHKVNDSDFIDSKVFPLLPNTILLFCSDGLTDMITSANIKTILGGKGDVEQKTDTLIDAALNAGGKDNVTVVLVEFLSDEPEPVVVEPEPDVPTVVSQNGKAIEEEKEKNIQQPVSPSAPSQKKNTTVFACLIGGLLIGAAIAFFGMYGKMNSLKSEFWQKEKQYTDSINALRNGDILAPSTLQETMDSINSELLLKIEDLKKQNDTLQMKLQETMSQKQQLENKLNHLKEQINQD